MVYIFFTFFPPASLNQFLNRCAFVYAFYLYSSRVRSREKHREYTTVYCIQKPCVRGTHAQRSMTPVADSMKSIALRAACNKSYYGGYPTDLSGYAATRCRSPPRSSPAPPDDMDDISVGRPSPPASAECYARLHETGPDCSSSSTTATTGNRSHHHNHHHHLNHHRNESDSSSSGDDDGRCGGDTGSADYFEPLKKLGTVQIDKVSYGISDRKSFAPKRRAHRIVQTQQQQAQQDDVMMLDCTRTMGAVAATEDGSSQQPVGVKSFSIADILSHEPKTQTAASSHPSEDAGKIVRPWAEEYQPSPCSSFVPPPPPPPPAHRQPAAAAAAVVGALFPHSLFIQHLQHQQQQQHHHQHQHNHHHHHSNHLRPKSADYETSTCTSGRSSTDGSECCTSPEIASCTQSNPSSSSAAAQARKQQAAGGKNNDNSSPLDALFQMTSKTFDQLHGDPSGAGKSENSFTRTCILILCYYIMYKYTHTYPIPCTVLASHPFYPFFMRPSTCTSYSSSLVSANYKSIVYVKINILPSISISCEFPPMTILYSRPLLQHLFPRNLPTP